MQSRYSRGSAPGARVPVSGRVIDSSDTGRSKGHISHRTPLLLAYRRRAGESTCRPVARRYMSPDFEKVIPKRRQTLYIPLDGRQRTKTHRARAERTKKKTRNRTKSHERSSQPMLSLRTRARASCDLPLPRLRRYRSEWVETACRATIRCWCVSGAADLFFLVEWVMLVKKSAGSRKASEAQASQILIRESSPSCCSCCGGRGLDASSPLKLYDSCLRNSLCPPRESPRPRTERGIPCALPVLGMHQV